MRKRILTFLLLAVTAVLLTSCKGTTYSCEEFSIGGFKDYSVFTEPSQPDSVIQFEDPKWAGSHV